MDVVLSALIPLNCTAEFLSNVRKYDTREDVKSSPFHCICLGLCNIMALQLDFQCSQNRIDGSRVKNQQQKYTTPKMRVSVLLFQCFRWLCRLLVLVYSETTRGEIISKLQFFSSYDRLL